MYRFIYQLVLLGFSTNLLIAQTPVMIKDIRTGKDAGFWISSLPLRPVNIEDTLFFGADNGINGPQLWRSNGTSNGTYMVDNKPLNNNSFPQHLTNVNGIVFFVKSTQTTGSELWRSDGTAGGTYMVKDIRPGSNGSFPDRLTNVNGTLFFTADNGTAGSEIWRSDGTVDGTIIVKDIVPGSGNSDSDYLTNVGGVLYFGAYDDTTGRQFGHELWRSNGTPSGTYIVKDIDLGKASFGGPGNLIAVGDILYFTYGSELWRSNGTATGTYMIKDMRFSEGRYEPSNLTNVNSILFFSINSELWRSDGTASGTYAVKDMYQRSSNSNGISLKHLTNVNGTLYFTAYDAKTGRELWRSNGNPDSTYMIKDINPITIQPELLNVCPGCIDPDYLTNVNGTLFFTADNGTTGRELWRSNGTADGTYIVKDINPGRNASAPYYLTNVNGTLYFTADDGVHGQELWKLEKSSKQEDVTTQHFHQLPLNSAFRDRKFLAQNQTFKLCADGSNASIFKVFGGGRNYSTIAFRIKEYPTNSGADTSLGGRFTIITRHADSLVVRYRHPSHFATDLAKATSFTTLTLQLVETGASTSTAVQSYTLTVHRAPVVMVHGLWSGGDAFVEMEKALLQSNMYSQSLLKQVDYWATANREFSFNVPQVIVGIDNHIKALRDAGIAAGKVDYVAHSMGGILGRLYLQRTTYRQDIHKLITLNTPHSGSQMANFLLSNTNQSANDFFCHYIIEYLLKGQLCDGGAINDLQVDSKAIDNLNSNTDKNRNIVPSHTIVTRSPVKLEEIIPFGLMKINLVSTWIWNSLSQIGINSIFDNIEDNDLIVASVSQRGGLIGDQWTLIEDQMHMGAPAKSEVIQKVKFLLSYSPFNSAFSQTGFNPVKLTYKPVYSEPVVVPTNATVKIINPTRGSQFNPNVALNVSVSGSNISEIRTIVRYNKDSVYVTKELTSSVSYSTLTGTEIGKRQIIVMGRTASGAIVSDTSHFFVVQSCLQVNITGRKTLCTGSSSALAASVTGGTAPFNYKWKLGTAIIGNNSNSFAPTAPGMYTVEVTDSKGCQGTSAVFTVTQQAIPTMTTSSSSIVTGGTAILQTTISTGQSVQWLFNDTPIAGATQTTYTATQSGSYTVRVTNSEGCSSVSQAITISLVTVIEEPKPGNELTISALPNPSSGVVEIRLYNPQGKVVSATLLIHNLSGRSLYKKRVNIRSTHTERIDLSQQPAGIYLLNVSTAYQQTNLRLVRQ